MSTILIVDDNKNNLQVLGNVLNESKYRVAMAINGNTALRLAEKTHPDLIVLDIMMPEMDGFEVCKRLKADAKTADIPVIFLTAKTDLEDVVKGFQLGGVDYITKPFKKEELLVRVKNHINLVESRKVIEQQANELRAANSLKDKLLSVVASDINNGMNTFIEVPKLLLDERIDYSIDDFREMFANLKQKAEHTQNLLENVIWWTRSQRGLLTPRYEVLKLQKVVEDVVNILRPSIKEKNLNINIDVGDFDILADKEYVSLVVKNLLDNSIKYSFNGKNISIKANLNNAFVNLQIRDEGVGMKKEIVEKITNKHTYHTEYGTLSEKGNGIGIKLVLDLLYKIDSKLSIKSKEENGTTVTIEFPIAN